MRVLLIGSGGREHALAVGLAADPAVSRLVAAPGNPGIAAVRLASAGQAAGPAPAGGAGGVFVELRSVDIADPTAVAALAVDVGAELVVVGPEMPLVAGAADAVRAKGIACFGPSAAAAQLEGSKAYAKEVMASAGVPTARSEVCAGPDETAAALDRFGPPYVVKDDGLAAGKGVVVTADRVAALAHAASCGRVVVEEYLAGPEVSLFVVTDGTAAVPLLPAQDFKRIGDGDTGPNTGGMGAYAPLPWTPPGMVDDVMERIVRPTLAEMAGRGNPFTGLLYVGLALTGGRSAAGAAAAGDGSAGDGSAAGDGDGPKVIEFNCRFGDPETQAVLALLETPLGGLLEAAATGTLGAHPPLRWRTGAAVTVVVAAQGYPGAPRTGDVITGADLPGIAHAGTARRAADGALLSAGGRVLSCTGTGADLAAARDAAYRLVDGVVLTGSQHRTDIALAAAEGRISVPG